MAGLDEYIFGYSVGRVDKSDVPHLATALFKLGISSSITCDGDFTLRQRDRHRLLEYAKGKIRIELGEAKGLYGMLIGALRRRCMLFALFFVTAFFLLTRTLVWDVRIDGNDTLSDSEIEDVLRENGFWIGASWSDVDSSSVEAAVLASHPEIAWISLNRRGTVAYVEIIESENVGIRDEIVPLYSNILADRDGVVEEITVKSGAAVVKIGDVVRKGDILISGVVETERGVTLCRAEGTVRARSAIDVSAESIKNVNEQVYKERFLADVRVILFNFSINIFKNYGNYGDTCDIIEEIKESALLGRYSTPFALRKIYVREYDTVTHSLTEDEMIAEAKKELDEIIYSTFKDSDVLKLRTTGEFSDGLYRMTTRVVYVTDIGEESAIEIT